MMVSGGLCGLAGFLLVSGTNHTVSKNLAGGMGFTAIMVSWLAKFNPILMIITSFLIVFLQKGAGKSRRPSVLTKVFPTFLPESSSSYNRLRIFINYKINFRKKLQRR